MVGLSKIEALLGEAGKELADLMKLQGNLVFLKQFRSVTDGTKTCYQSVVEAPISLNKFEGAGISKLHDITFTELESNPIAKTLGIAPTQNSVFSIWGKVQVTIENGKEIESHKRSRCKLLQRLLG